MRSVPGVARRAKTGAISSTPNSQATARQALSWRRLSRRSPQGRSRTPRAHRTRASRDQRHSETTRLAHREQVRLSQIPNIGAAAGSRQNATFAIPVVAGCHPVRSSTRCGLARSHKARLRPPVRALPCKPFGFFRNLCPLATLSDQHKVSEEETQNGWSHISDRLDRRDHVRPVVLWIALTWPPSCRTPRLL
jgi:hypothetical protein